MSTLEKAIALAARAHEGQVDKIGRPFILHPLRLMLRSSDEKVQVVAVLHDVVEDCGPYWGHMALALAHEMGVEEALRAVTKVEGETYFEFIRRARAAGYVARTVKMLDVGDHIAEAHTPELRKMVETRYLKAWRMLLGAEE